MITRGQQLRQPRPPRLKIKLSAMHEILARTIIMRKG